MATIQKKTSRGRKYWYIVESRRVNGKPRPVVLAYLGKAEDLLARLTGTGGSVKVKSFSHGGVAALLNVAQELEVPAIINKYVESPRAYMAKKPVRNNLTVGMTILLGAIGRVCMPTSKRGWWRWARTTSCEYLLRCALSRIDSQHFWDLMDALPVDSIEQIEAEILLKVKERYSLEIDTLFYDTTNFFTYIATANQRCEIARRGRNKQKRNDLRQVGLALVVTRKDFIPLFHLTYQGNRHDSKVFAEVPASIKKRMKALGLDLEKHTLVFDRGNNSKKNMGLVADSKLHYVGALTPYQHTTLLQEAWGRFEPVEINGESIGVYRGEHEVWGEQRTVVVFVSERLKAGQLRGVYTGLKKRMGRLEEIRQTLAGGKTRMDKATLENKVSNIVKGQFIGGVIEWAVREGHGGRLELVYRVNESRLVEMEDDLGLRILMTDRHDWDTAEIIRAYHGQSTIEAAFKNLKNPYHLALKPQFHWTDQKIIVHYFMCVLGYLLTTLVWRQAREIAGFKGSLDSLLDTLNNIRLAALIEQPKGRGRPKATYKIEEISKEESTLLESLGIDQLHIKRPHFKGVGVYK
jgi:transposase